jgi:1-acyl-sn-glycerol-3-phosphate acyltransferase
VTQVAASRLRTFYASPRKPTLRTKLLAGVSGLVVCAASIAILPIACLTLFRARTLYAAFTCRLARALLRMWGVQVKVHGHLSPVAGQQVYISNHSSSLDVFLLVALGLPNTRFFLSGFLRRIVPLAILARLMGTFFTVPQDRPEERRRIFARASNELRRTGESVYLSPEGARITTGEIGPFNKGAFHLATALGAPIVPLYFMVPAHMDPGMGYDVRPGTVEIFVKTPIDTSRWHVDDVTLHKEAARRLFVQWHEEARALRQASPPPGGYEHAV